MQSQEYNQFSGAGHAPWNKNRLIGLKPPLKLREIWAIRFRLQLAKRTREFALFNLAIDSKLRGCDLTRLRVQDVAHGGKALARATIMQRKTGQPVKFELTEQTRNAIEAWITKGSFFRGNFCSRAGYISHRTSRLGSMRGS